MPQHQSSHPTMPAQTLLGNSGNVAAPATDIEIGTGLTVTPASPGIPAVLSTTGGGAAGPDGSIQVSDGSGGFIDGIGVVLTNDTILGNETPTADDNYNTVVGWRALKSNTSGNSNVAIGASAAEQNETGIYNTALGDVALWHNKSGNANLAVGAAALYNVDEGDFNTGIGESAGYNITTGNKNITIGFNSTVSDPTADSQLSIGNDITGVLGTEIRVGSQFTVGTPSGSPSGAGTVNTSGGVFKNGVEYSTSGSAAGPIGSFQLSDGAGGFVASASTDDGNGGALTISGGNVLLQASGAEGSSTIQGADDDGVGGAGNATLRGGTDAGFSAGVAHVLGGESNTTGVKAGTALIDGGSATTGDADGGDVIVAAGNPSGAGVRGVITFDPSIQVGSPTGATDQGDVNISGQFKIDGVPLSGGGLPPGGSVGQVVANTGSGTGDWGTTIKAVDGLDVSLTGGDGGGAVTLTGGVDTGASAGVVYIQGGPSVTTGVNAGTAYFLGGDASNGDASGGQVIISGGAPSGTGLRGNVLLTAGTASVTAVAGAATANFPAGKVTSEALVGAVTYTLTLTNNIISTTSIVEVNATNSANLPVTISTITEGSGSVVIVVAMAALTGTVVIRFKVNN